MNEAALHNQELLIITGMSGAGRSTAANSLEDLGWYVVDNLPPQMLKPLVDLAQQASSGMPKIAAVVDIRGRDFFVDLQEILANLRSGTQVRVLFLQATDSALVKRFENVRRPHPLQADGTILDGIAQERILMSELRANSDIVIDTSELNVHQLAKTINDYFGDHSSHNVKVTVMSFGFKYGTPADADNILDARFLPNPFWVPKLRQHNGLEVPVSEYVLSRPGALDFLDHLTELLKPVLAGYAQENKRHATIAIGCTGGKHRSVALSEEMTKRLAEVEGISVTVRHRDLGRE